MKRLTLLLFVLIFSVPVFAQIDHPNRIPGELLVFLKDDASIQSILRKQNAGRSAATLRYMRPLGQVHNIHALAFDESQNPNDVLLSLKALPEVLAVQYNYEVEDRNIPDDPFYEFQWHMERIGMQEVWDASTGGLTTEGDTIVVAVLDSGFDLSHPDLIPNVWRNHAEIPNDSIDNDGNGYIDDYLGWNFLEQQPEHRINSHGTSVSGLIGAKGNNGLGITGVNWDIKMMILNTRDVNSIVEAYEYVIYQRQLYNETNGAEGAFIVSTNASFGIDRSFCGDFPVWEAMYDLMGEVGVLTGSGTSNSTYDVDDEGDMPSSCESDFIITVLNTTELDEKNDFSAFGRRAIDMGSPGQGSYTVDLNNAYDTFGGNSAAAPHVTGAIAMLYSLDCDSIAVNAKTNPQLTALVIRDILLRSVDTLETLENITATGGRLNVAKAANTVLETCGGTKGDLEVINIYPNPVRDRITVSYETPEFSDYQVRIVNTLGQSVIKNTVFPPQFGFKKIVFDVSHLAPGTYFMVIDKGDAIESKAFIKM